MIWLLPAALCSITIAGILKVNEGRKGDRLLLAGANYIVASALSFLRENDRQENTAPVYHTTRVCVHGQKAVSLLEGDESSIA